VQEDLMTIDIARALDWRPPEGWKAFAAVDAHAAGEPLRVILSGWPDLGSGPILERRRRAREHLDDLRTVLMWEPRGHADMYGCVVLPPASEQADFGVLFVHNEGFSTMCGHGIIAVTTVMLETGAMTREEPSTEVRIDTPAGMVRARARVEGDRVTEVSFENVPSFVLHRDRVVQVPGLGDVRCDVAFGGAFYAFVEAADVGVDLTPGAVRDLLDMGVSIKRAVSEACAIEHPFESDLGFLYGTIFTGPAHAEGVHSRNVCVFADGEVDRSPTGTGVSARAALHVERGDLAIGETMVVESIIGSRFRVTAIRTTQFGSHPAVVPEVAGRAHVTGRHEFCLDPNDDLAHGFLVR
jgi:trans-L-3-hydroxyproline dehydratase